MREQEIGYSYCDELSYLSVATPTPLAGNPGTAIPPREVPMLVLTDVNANALRRAAEKADGLRGKTLALVVDEKGLPDVIELEEAEKNHREVLLKLETSNIGQGLPGTAKIRVVNDNQTYGEGTILRTADAVFTSQSAVEKFVLPYYMRFKSADDIKKLQETLFLDEHVFAAAHIPPSSTNAVESQLYGLFEKGGKSPGEKLI